MISLRILMIAAALVAPATLALANPGDGYRPDNGDEGDTGTVPDMPDAALFGLCTAWNANETGRENGNAGNAGPFVWLQQQADENDQTVEEYCAENARHPGLA